MALPTRIIRGHVIMGIIVVCALAAAALTLLKLWAVPMDAVIFGKSLATIFILGLMAGFVGAVDIDMVGAGKRRWMLLGLIGMCLVCGTMWIAQLWWQVMEWDTFIKIKITMLVLVVLDGFLLAVSEDLGSTRKLKDEKYID